MNTLYIAWQDPQTRLWHTVGRLEKLQKGYRFSYTKGAEASPRFTSLGRMFDKNSSYYSEKLFPLFTNRLLQPSRPEYPDYLEWMGIDQHADSMELLARSGGYRETDRLCVYADVVPDAAGHAEIYFFSHGLRYLGADEQQTIQQLEQGSALKLVQDTTVEQDRFALMLRSNRVKVGYCPRYLSQSLYSYINNNDFSVTVERNNPAAPLQFRLLCKVQFTLSSEQPLYATEEHQPLKQNPLAA